ncbi:MAG: hypothetical protein IKT76_08040 [Bacteroides sp.]|nr:hypothetical protein [Bacteroides sp.]
MKSKILLLLVSLCTVSLMAQEGDIEAVKKEIRDIKLSEKYIYGEGTSAKSLEIAHDIAAEKMHVNILTMLTDEGYTSKDANTRWEQLQSSLRCLEYHQGPLYKSFVYLPEVALLKEVAADETETPAEETTTDPIEVVEIVEEVAPPVEQVLELVVADTIAVAEVALAEVVEETIEVVEEVVAADTIQVVELVIEEEVAGEEVVEEELVEEAVAAVATDTIATPEQDFSLEAARPAQVVVNHPFDEMPDYHQRIIRELLDLDTYDAVMLYLDTMKEDGRIMFGSVNTLINPEQAYLIIIKDGQLVTILNRGKGERTNLKTNTPDLLNNYRGYAVIWMKIYS